MEFTPEMPPERPIEGTPEMPLDKQRQEEKVNVEVYQDDKATEIEEKKIDTIEKLKEEEHKPEEIKPAKDYTAGIVIGILVLLLAVWAAFSIDWSGWIPEENNYCVEYGGWIQRDNMFANCYNIEQQKPVCQYVANDTVLLVDMTMDGQINEAHNCTKYVKTFEVN